MTETPGYCDFVLQASHTMNTQDVERVASFFHDDATYDYVPLQPPMKGKEEIKTFFEDLFIGFPDFHVEQRNSLISGNILITECTITATHLGELYITSSQQLEILSR